MTLSKLINKAVEEATKELKEKLADIEHQRWADWQRYLHSKLTYCEYEDNGKKIACYVMDAGDYEHWSKQINTDYKDLTEKEKDSDREQVDRYLPILSQAIDRVEEEAKQDISNKLHGMVCDLSTKHKELAKEDCLELIRYQIERISGRKLKSLSLNK